MDPVIPADILTALLAIGLAVVPTWLVLRWAVRAVARKRARLVKPETHGDDGGWPPNLPDLLKRHRPRPKAPETGSGLHVGGEWD